MRESKLLEQLQSERSVFDAGFFGLGPPDIQIGDMVCLFYGAQTPFVIRPCEGGRFRLVGDAFVKDVMYDAKPELKENPRVFSII